jgi:Outer membrane protein beta-barrel domain
MKKTTFLLAIACASISSQVKAQFTKGTIMVGPTIGTTAYSSANSNYQYDNEETRSTGTKTYSFSVGPQIGVFIARNVVAGASLALSFSNTQANTTLNSTAPISGSKTTTNSLTVSVGPYIRYYFANHFSNNLFYGQIDGSIGSGSGNSSGSAFSTTTTSTSIGKVNSIFNWNAGASLGMSHFFNKHIAMDVALGYRYTIAKSDNLNNTQTVKTSNNTNTPSTNNYNLKTTTNGVTLSAGFHWFL